MKRKTIKFMVLVMSLLMVISFIPISALSYAEESNVSEQEQTIEKSEDETINQPIQENKNTLQTREADDKASGNPVDKDQAPKYHL